MRHRRHKKRGREKSTAGSSDNELAAAPSLVAAFLTGTINYGPRSVPSSFFPPCNYAAVSFILVLLSWWTSSRRENAYISQLRAAWPLLAVKGHQVMIL